MKQFTFLILFIFSLNSCESTKTSADKPSFDFLVGEWIRTNEKPDRKTYENWKKVDKKYKFVIMKATEGKDFLDTDFFYNWNNARLNGFTVGAYHFFSMLSSGKAQAEYYISKVPYSEKTLPPVIDLEIPIRHRKKAVLKELRDMISRLEAHYKKRVIIYVTYHTYNAYIKGEFLDNKLWIRDIKFHPELEENDRWIIWQVSNRGRVNGIPNLTDKNVLRSGTVESLIEESRIE